MEWVARLVDQVSPGTSSATAGVKAFRTELAAASAELKAFEAAGGRLGGTAAAAGGGLTEAAAGAQATTTAATNATKAAAGAAAETAAAGQAIRPVWAQGQAQARAASGAFGATGKAAVGAGAAAGAAGKAAAGAGAAAAQAGAKGAGALSAMKKASASATAALGNLQGGATLLLGALGLAGAMGVAKLALGARGMQQLDAITARTQTSVRLLFAKVDPSPVVRAYNRFSQIFSASTVTGRTLGDIFTRSFNALFAAVEKAEPIVTAFAQGAVLGFRILETGVLRVRLALLPYTSILEDVVSSTSLMRVAAVGGGIALAVAGAYAAAAAAPFLLMAGAILAVAAALEQATKLAKEWDENSASQIWRKFKSDIGLGGSQLEQERAQGIVQGDDFDRMQREKAAAAAAKPAATAPATAAGASTQAAAAKGASPQAAAAAGQATGAAMAQGMVAGMNGGQAAVTKAGADLAAAADRGVRDKAEIRSPSRLFRRTAEYMPEGTVQGLRAGSDDVQRASDALVPQPPGAAARPGAGDRGPMVIQIGRIEAPHVFDPGGLASFVRGVAQGEAIHSLESIGVPA